MEQQFRQPEAERLTPVEAEEVIKRFRDEEVQRQKDMEAQATNPTVADLAEGLGVSHERIAALLAQIRGDAVPPAPFRAEPMTAHDAESHVRRSNQTAWIIAAAILGSLLVLAMFAALFYSAPAAEVSPPSVETTAPVAPTTDAAAPSETGAPQPESDR